MKSSGSHLAPAFSVPTTFLLNVLFRVLHIYFIEAITVTSLFGDVKILRALKQIGMFNKLFSGLNKITIRNVLLRTPYFRMKIGYYVVFVTSAKLPM